MSEIIFLGILALIIIGPKELPEVARTLGRFLNDLKRSSSSLTEDLKQHAKFDLDLDLNKPLDRIQRIKEDSVSTDTIPTEPEQLELADHASQIQSVEDENRKKGNTET